MRDTRCSQCLLQFRAEDVIDGLCIWCLYDKGLSLPDQFEEPCPETVDPPVFCERWDIGASLGYPRVIKQKTVDPPVSYEPPSYADRVREQYGSIMEWEPQSEGKIKYGLLRKQGGKLKVTPYSLLKDWSSSR